MMAARASSTVRSADRPDSTASRRSSGSSARKPVVGPPNEGRNRRDHQMLSSTAATSTTTSRMYKMTVSGTLKLDGGCRFRGSAVFFGGGLALADDWGGFAL